jgi:glycosyltransferase involved in cell wall biosynthesis
MANQTRQLAQLLRDDEVDVTLVQTNSAVRPAWMSGVRGVRAFFRLVPYAARLWRALAHADVVHVMANSGWSWHLCAAPAIWLSALRGVPVVVNYRGGGAEPFLERQHGVVRQTLARAAALVVPSGFLAAVFAKHGFSARIVQNIVDLRAFTPADSPPSGPHVVVTRNLEAIYDNATALRAFAALRQRHPAARMTIAGEGPERQPLEALCETLGIAAAVRFTGRLDNAALPELYRSATVVVNPSTVDNMPVSLLEALACGVPIVSTNVGGIPFLVEHDVDALLVPARDSAAMAEALLRVTEEPALALRLRQAGIATARRYAWPAVRPLLFAAYADAMASAARGRAFGVRKAS